MNRNRFISCTVVVPHRKFAAQTTSEYDMILLATFSNELEAQLLESQLSEAGVDVRIQPDAANGFKVMVFEDDLDLAKEILASKSMDDEDFTTGFDDINLDELEDV